MKVVAVALAACVLAACSDRSATPDAPTVDARRAAPAAPEPGAAPGDAGADAPAAAPDASTPSAPPNPTDSAPLEADYLGRWVGVEGMVLVVAPKPGGGVTLDMQWDLDHRGTFNGSVTAEGLRFMRQGVAEIAVHSDGDATGLKHLAGKRACLTVKPGEGYCRD